MVRRQKKHDGRVYSVDDVARPGFNSLAEVFIRKFYVYDYSTVLGLFIKTRMTVSSLKCFRNTNRLE